jgi:RimJ/RimL family protein N-acetyltransferase
MQPSPADLTALARTPYRIVCDRVVLRCFRAEDAPLRQAALDGSPTVQRFLALDAPLTLEQHAAVLRKFRALFDGDQDCIYAVLPRDESRLLGECFLLKRAGHEAREIGYVFYEEGQGYATEAARALVIAAFRALALRRMDLVYKTDNARSARVAEKLGFVREGLLRGRTTPNHPVPEDVWMTSLLRAEAERAWASWPAPEVHDFLGRAIA